MRLKQAKTPRYSKAFGGLFGVVWLLFLSLSASKADDVFQTKAYSLKLVTVATGLANPWSIAFLPNGDALVTERAGRLRLIEKTENPENPYQLTSDAIAGLPAVAAHGQGGLLDIALHPNFAENRWLYLSFVDETDAGFTTRLMRAKYQDNALQNVEMLFEALPRSRAGQHFGGRLHFDKQGDLYLSIGDRGERNRAQDGLDHAGSIIRLHDDGQIPTDNPFVGDSRVLDAIYSTGHRNPQGMAIHPDTGEIWINEHGPRGGDEINRIEAGANYGWPLATFGVNYIGTKITDNPELPGMVSPLLQWTPSIAPSGMIFYTGDAFPEWQGQLLNGALAHRLISRVAVVEADDGYELTEIERLLSEFNQRIRDIRQSPDGALWLLTDERRGGVYQIQRVD
ncbi:PQQ-dependent sugar dehydrogenase [Ostreibacterium oceani]|uniref:PQQ-dependent sugar dehydrogenase n=1 Tax=Ostreibacterium oceani TaxID=2654998 RepID=A0A6N7EZ05_9GAMM|nr:PQQ-dependent sugar dehydrogenase [Ostreibacterium oceani]MPV86775.1 PQQ-dependent sugar dehydrogenase [Ostreibacterium oceani]